MYRRKIPIDDLEKHLFDEYPKRNDSETNRSVA